MKTDKQIIDEILVREGDRYTDHPADKGGPTRYGITRAALQRWRSRQKKGLLVTPYDVQTLTEAEARAIYEQDYVIGPGFHRITNAMLRGLVVDSCVQHGADDPIRWMQQEARVAVDGVFGPASAAAINAMPVRQAYARVLARRCAYYGQLITKDPVRVQAQRAGYRMQAENAHGWANRLAEFIDETSQL